MTTYEIRTRLPVAGCSPRSFTYTTVHDALKTVEDGNPEDWEHFGVDSVPLYIQKGMLRVQENLKRLADFSEPYLATQGTELQFMIEALVQARSVLE